MTKDAFSDDESLEVPQPRELCRASTAPLPSCCSRASTDGNETPRSSLRGMLGFSVPSSPQSTAEGLTPLPTPGGFGGSSPSRPHVGAEPLSPLHLPPAAVESDEEDHPLPEGTDWALVTKGTFLEFVWSRRSAAPRSSSTGAVGRGLRPPAVEVAEAAEAVQSAADRPVQSPEATPAACTPDAAAEVPVGFVFQPPPVFDYCGTLGPYGGGWWLGEANPAVLQTWPAGMQEAPAWTPRVEIGGEAQGSRRRDRRREAAGARQPIEEKDVYEVIAAATDHPGKVWDLARQNQESSRLVQTVFRFLIKDIVTGWCEEDWFTYNRAYADYWTVLRDFYGHVVDALKHPHANHVVKLLVEEAPTYLISDLVHKELLGQEAVDMAKHNYGCRTILRLVRHCGAGTPESIAVEAVMQSVVRDAKALCQHEFGKFVVEELVRSPVAQHRHAALEALGVGPGLRQQLLANATHKHASGLIVQALNCLDRAAGEQLVGELLSGDAAAKALVSSQYGLWLLRDIDKTKMHPRVGDVLERFKSDAKPAKAAKGGRGRRGDYRG